MARFIQVASVNALKMKSPEIDQYLWISAQVLGLHAVQTLCALRKRSLYIFILSTVAERGGEWLHAQVHRHHACTWQSGKVERALEESRLGFRSQLCHVVTPRTQASHLTSQCRLQFPGRKNQHQWDDRSQSAATVYFLSHSQFTLSMLLSKMCPNSSRL